MQVVVRQISGLGNQLFQYAAGVYYSGQYNAALRLVLDRAGNRFSHGLARPVLLSHFRITAPMAEMGAMDELFLSPRRKLQPLVHAARTVARVSVFQEQSAERYRLLPAPPADGLRTLYLVGYWQTYRIAEAVEGRLREEFTFREAPTGRNAELLGAIRGTACPVSLHMRRGDYTLAVEGNIALPLGYYERAIAAVKDKLPAAKFYIFSDDPGFAREHLPRDLDAVFVDHNDDYTSYEDLRLMSNCRHHILANSSFSWWGAWLNPYKDKMVIAPRQWLLQPGSAFPELTPPAWHLLDVV